MGKQLRLYKVTEVYAEGMEALIAATSLEDAKQRFQERVTNDSIQFIRTPGELLTTTFEPARDETGKFVPSPGDGSDEYR